MTTFLDGPAKGEVLRLKAAPLFLRVVQNGPCFDALDMPGDEPEPTELVYVYLRTGGTFTTATYQLLDRQPTDDEARNIALWQAWALRVQALRKQERELQKSSISNPQPPIPLP